MANKICLSIEMLCSYAVLTLLILGSSFIIPVSSQISGEGNDSPSISIPKPDVMELHDSGFTRTMDPSYFTDDTNTGPAPTPNGDPTPAPTPNGDPTPTPTPNGDPTPTPTPNGDPNSDNYVDTQSKQYSASTSSSPNLDTPSGTTAPVKKNELWVKGQSRTSQYTLIPVGDDVQLIIDPCAQGIADVYELDLDKDTVMKYKKEVSMGKNIIDLAIQRPGRYLLIYVLNNQPSNAVTIDAISGSSLVNNQNNAIKLGTGSII